MSAVFLIKIALAVKKVSTYSSNIISMEGRKSVGNTVDNDDDNDVGNYVSNRSKRDSPGPSVLVSPLSSFDLALSSGNRFPGTARQIKTHAASKVKAR